MIRNCSYQDEDREQVISLWKTCKLTHPWNNPDKDLDRKKGAGNELFIILEVENQLFGTVMGGYDGHRGVMNYLAVHPKLQGRGYGKMLVEAIENKLINLGCPKVNLLIRRDNNEVSNFYESVQYAKQEDILVFGKRLTSDN